MSKINFILYIFKAQQVIPLTLNGFFFHLAHLLCRNELYNIAENNPHIEEKFHAMTGLLRYFY